MGEEELRGIEAAAMFVHELSELCTKMQLFVPRSAGGSDVTERALNLT